MQYDRTTYVELMDYDGGNVRKCRSGDVSKVPKDTFGFYGFQFFDVISVVVKVDGKNVVLRSKQLNISRLHFYGGKIYTVAQMKQQFLNDPLVMKRVGACGDNDKWIRNRAGSWEPFKPSHVFVPKE